MFDVLYLVFCAAAWGIVAYKVRAWLRDRRNVDLGLLSTMTAGVATVFLFSAPSFYRWFDRLAGVANLSIVVIYTAVVVFASGAWVLLLRWTGRAGEAARRTAAAGAGTGAAAGDGTGTSRGATDAAREQPAGQPEGRGEGRAEGPAAGRGEGQAAGGARARETAGEAGGGGRERGTAGREAERTAAARARIAVRARLVVTGIGAVWTVAVGCFAFGRPDAVEHPRDFSTAYTSEPGVVAFLVLYLAIFAISLAALGRLCRTYAAALGATWLGRGLRVIAAGCWLGLLYCACKLAGFAGSWAGLDMYPVSNGIAPLSASVAALLVIGGFAVPAAGPRVSAWRRLRKLHALWRDVTAHAPEVTMGHSRWAAWWPLADQEWRANRQMAEIRDVQRGIRTYVDAAVIDIARDKGRAAALDEAHTTALIEAAALRRGLANQAVGRVPPYDAESAVLTVSTELAQEHAHLVRVASVYRLPLVDDVLAAVRDYRETTRT